MPRPSIDYLNARREAIRNGRGVSKGLSDRVVNPVDTRRRDADQHSLDLAHDQVLAIFADFRSWFAESTRALHAGDLAEGGDYVPF